MLSSSAVIREQSKAVTTTVKHKRNIILQVSKTKINESHDKKKNDQMAIEKKSLNEAWRKVLNKLL